jgi:hypothetical protein
MKRSKMPARTAACVVSMIFLAGLAQGQQAKPAEGLEGPKVTDPAAPGTNRKFTGGGGNARERAQQTPMPAFVRALQALEGEKAAESVRLTSEQAASLKKMGEDYAAAIQSYRAEHRAEIEKLRDMLPPQERRRVDGFLREGAGRGGKPNAKGEQKPAKQDPMQEDPMSEGGVKSPADAEAAKARLRELLEGAPSVADAQAKMWAVLSAEQKPVVEKELARMREEAGKRGAGKGAKGDGKAAPGGEIDMSKLPPRLRERLEKMTPEEREAAIRQYRERRETEGKRGDQPKKPE